MKWSVVVAAFALGAIATFAITKNVDTEDSGAGIKDAFEKEVTIQDIDQPLEDIADQHDKVMSRMMKIFDSMKMPDMDMAFDKGSLSMGSSDINVKTTSDDKYKYIEVFGDNLDPKAINVTVEKGMVSISGRIEKQVEREKNGMKSNSRYVSSFQRSFNIPEGVDENDVSFEPQDKKLIIKFKRV